MQVLDGLKPGERVVTQATFLIDAESNLHAALAAFTRARSANDRPPHPLVGPQLMLVFIATAFAGRRRPLCRGPLPLDAIPDLSDTQVIVYTEMPGQAPQVVEDQVTYPLTTAMLTVPTSRGRARLLLLRRVVRLRHLRGRHRHLLGALPRAGISQLRRAKLPTGVKPTLGPDATGVGWVYQYAVLARTDAGGAALAAGLGRPLRACEGRGVAEVASVGGFVRQYKVVVDPLKLAASIFRSSTFDAIRAINRDVGGRVVEIAETEFMVRGRGYFRASPTSSRSWSRRKAHAGAAERRRPRRAWTRRAARHRRAQWRGRGRGGIALQRSGENALDVIDNVKAKLHEIAARLPEGVSIVPVYDRSELIHRAIATLKSTLFEESLVVALVCIVFLLHVRSALVAILTLPVGVLMAFIAMHVLGHRLQHHEPRRHRHRHRRDGRCGHRHDRECAQASGAAAARQAARRNYHRGGDEVGPALFFSLLVITVSFLPIFTLETQEGRLFKPLAFTKTFAMAAAAILSVTLGAGADDHLRARSDHPGAKNPLNRALIGSTGPSSARAEGEDAHHRAGAGHCWRRRLAGDAGRQRSSCRTSTRARCSTCRRRLPGLSITKSAELLQTQDRIIKSFPEVASVYGKAGRAQPRLTRRRSRCSRP